MTDADLPNRFQAPAADAATPLRSSPASGFVLGPPDRRFPSNRKMTPCPVFPVVGTITAIGPSMLDKGGVLYRYIEFCERGGRIRRLTVVRAVEALASLIRSESE